MALTHDAPTGAQQHPVSLLTMDEARRELRLGMTKFTELVATGELASIRVGRRRLIPADAITAFVAGRLAAGGRGGGQVA